MNVLCPNIFSNCCTNHDQMKIHKIWRDATRPMLKARENQFRQKWLQLKTLIDNLDNYDFDHLTTQFSKQALHPVDDFLLDHLYQISTIIKQEFESEEIKAFIDKSIKLQLKLYYQNLYTLRQSNLCMLCDFDSQKYINSEIKQLSYKEKFCDKLEKTFLNFHDKKYNLVIKYFMLVDEWIYLTSGRQLFQDGDKEIFRRYLLAIKKCLGGICDLYCSEYNVNGLNYLFDGEIKTFDVIDSNLIQFFVDIQKNSAKYYAEWNQEWDFDSFMSFRKYESVLEDFSDDYPRIHSDEFSGITILPSRSFFERIHKINSVQLETLDDEADMIVLFKTQNEPIDLHDYQIQILPDEGIDFYELAKNMQIKISVNKFMALLHFQTTISRHIPEILEKRIKKALKRIKVDDIINFKLDVKMRFKRFKPKNSTASAAGFFPRRRGLKKLIFQVKSFIFGSPPYPDPKY